MLKSYLIHALSEKQQGSESRLNLTLQWFLFMNHSLTASWEAEQRLTLKAAMPVDKSMRADSQRLD